MLLFNKISQIKKKRGLAIPALLFSIYGFAQTTILGCRPPSQTEITITQNDSFIYYTPRQYNTNSYIIRWDIISNKKDSFSFELAEIDGQYNYRLTDFSTNGKYFVLCYVDHVYLLFLDSDTLNFQSYKQLRNRAVEKSEVTERDVKIISTSTVKSETDKKLTIYTLNLEPLSEVKLTGSSLFLSHLSPSHYFSFNNNALMWVDPLGYKVYRRQDSLEFANEYDVNNVFCPPTKNTLKLLKWQSNIEGKLSVIMTELDSLKFDFIEELHLINDSSYIIIYSQKGSGMAVEKPWVRNILYFDGANLIKTEQLNSRIINVLDITFFIFNENIYCLTDIEGVLQIRSLKDVILK